MPTSQKIFLYGASGSGKTYIGELLKKELNIPVVEADQLREYAQKNTTREFAPFLFVGTCEAFRRFGSLTIDNVIRGLMAVRNEMKSFVEEEASKYSSCIMEGAFLNPAILSREGVCILISTVDAEQHRRQFFEHRQDTPGTREEFQAARMIQHHLLEEAKEAGVLIVNNDADAIAAIKKHLNV